MEKPDQTSSQNEFTPPRHWVALEELSPDYWSNEAEQSRRSQEFYHKPIETLEAIEKMDQSGVTRREFLTVMGASMAMASFACAKRPVNKIIPYVVQPVEAIPGNPVHFASTCAQCAKGCGILVKTREGRPIKLEGNDLHPSNQGALCAQGQASILELYDPERLRAPMKSAVKGTKGGAKSTATWAEIDSWVGEALKVSKSVRIVGTPKTGDSSRRLIKEFLAPYADGKLIEVEPLFSEDLADGQQESYGNRVMPKYAFDQAQMVVSIGADFLGTWGNIVENATKWSKKRKLEKTSGVTESDLSKLLVFESGFSITGANADDRYGIIPGAELALATAIAHELIVIQKRSRFANQADVLAALTGAKAEELLAKAGGLAKELVSKVASELWENRGKSLVVGSGTTELQVVINLLNSALENDSKTVDGNGNALPTSVSVKALNALIAEMKAGQIDTLILNRTNPVYFLPNGEVFSEALKQVKLVIVVGDRIDETAQFADLVAADNHFLESWGDAHASASIYSLQQPTISPIADTRSFEDSLIHWSRSAAKSSGLLSQVANSPKGSFYDFIKENWKQTLFPIHGKGKTFNQFWETSLKSGVLVGPNAIARERDLKVSSLKMIQEGLNKLKVVSVTQSKKGPAIEGSGLVLGLYPKVSMGDGRSANNAWLQEMPDPITTVTWDNYLNIGPSFAKDLGIQNWDVVTLKSDQGAVELPVNIQPGLLKGVVTAAVGYGRSFAGKVGTGVGANTFKLATFSPSSGLVLSGQSVSIEKTGKKYELAATQTHHRAEGRPIINDITLTEYIKNPAAENHTNPHLRLSKVPSLWTPPFDYSKSEYRWMMAVDMNSCTACGACVIACQAENNTPVVGRFAVRMSREMHWMKIDRYYSGDENNPRVTFQPMMCQHCENAPCETVCPVVATSHSEDGLNQMTYSRCVGTRYCQNNCPYKVRRFNFFDHWKDYKDTLNMVWNPDVTVRQRGIMEKCTFCVQRINEAKSHAKDQKNQIKDSDLKTACQQTCPTDAIVFGNVNDPESRISKLKNHPRAFRSLEVTNTLPSVHYLSKVRNAEPIDTHHSKEADHGQHS